MKKFYSSIVQCTLMSAILLGGSSCTDMKPLDKLESFSVAKDPETFKLEIVNYIPQNGNQFQNLFVSNFSTVVSKGSLLLSTARDGMSDDLKLKLSTSFGFTIFSSESVVPGFNDLVIFNMGIQTSQQNLLSCNVNQMKSSTNDLLIYNDNRRNSNSQQTLGLRDCVKSRMTMDPKKFDNDGDGIPDYLELICKTNPLNSNDAFISTAGDSLANIDKCKQHIPIAESSTTQPNQLFSYKYSTETNKDNSKNLIVDNIGILNGGEQNFIAIYLVEKNINSGVLSLFTAFAILKSDYNKKTLKVNYWAPFGASPNLFYNQEIAAP